MSEQADGLCVSVETQRVSISQLWERLKTFFLLPDGIYHHLPPVVWYLNGFHSGCGSVCAVVFFSLSHHKRKRALSPYWFRCLGQTQCVPNELWQHVYHTTPHSASHPRCLQNQQTALLSPPTLLNQNRPHSSHSPAAWCKTRTHTHTKFTGRNYRMQSHRESEIKKEIKTTYHSGHRDEVGVDGDDAELDFRETEKKRKDNTIIIINSLCKNRTCDMCRKVSCSQPGSPRRAGIREREICCLCCDQLP